MSIIPDRKTDNPNTDFDEDRLQMGDVYDVVKTVITVNSPITTMNPDFIMSDPNPDILTNPFILFIKNSLNNVEILNIYLGCKETEDEEYRLKADQILLNEVFSLTNMSRADKAKVIRGIIRYIEGQRQEQTTPITPSETEQEPQGLAKLNPLNLLKGKKKGSEE